MSQKKEQSYQKIYIVVFCLLIALWGGYYLFFFNYYNDAIQLTTEGAKIEIKTLELFYYRGTGTMISLVMYFALVCSHVFFIQYLRIRAKIENKKITINYASVILFILMVSISMFNVLWILYLVLVIVSLTVNHILYIVSESKYHYVDEEVIFEKIGVVDKDEAEKILSEQLKKSKKMLKKSKHLQVVGDIFLNEDNSYDIEVSIEKNNSKKGEEN